MPAYATAHEEDDDQQFSLPALPVELQAIILAENTLSSTDLAQCRRVCRSWHTLVDTEWRAVEFSRRHWFTSSLDLYRAYSPTFASSALPGSPPNWRRIIGQRLHIADEIFLEAFNTRYSPSHNLTLIAAAADLGNENAIFMLISAYWRGNYGVTQDPQKARDLILRYDQRGSPHAQQMHRDGLELGLYGFRSAFPTADQKRSNLWQWLFLSAKRP